MEPRTIAAASAGTSLFGTGVDQISRSIGSRSVTIEITNNSDTFILANPETHIIHGYCQLPPQPTIAKSKEGTCSFSNIPYKTDGAVGVLKYQILRNGKEHAGLAIMFSVPFNDENNYEKNTFAVGIFDKATQCNALFEMMRNENKGGSGNIVKGNGKGSAVFTNPVHHAVVKGTMSAGGEAVMKVEFWDK